MIDCCSMSAMAELCSAIFGLNKDCLAENGRVELCLQYDEMHELWKLNFPLSTKYIAIIFLKTSF